MDQSHKVRARLCQTVSVFTWSIYDNLGARYINTIPLL